MSYDKDGSYIGDDPNWGEPGHPGGPPTDHDDGIDDENEGGDREENNLPEMPAFEEGELDFNQEDDPEVMQAEGGEPDLPDGMNEMPEGQHIDTGPYDGDMVGDSPHEA